MPAECAATSEGELVRIQDWAQGCNLSLNRAKTKEIIFPATGPAISRTLSTLAYSQCPCNSETYSKLSHERNSLEWHTIVTLAYSTPASVVTCLCPTCEKTNRDEQELEY